MNKSPIEIIQSLSFKEQLEDNIMKAVQKVGIQVNKEELQNLIDKATPKKPILEGDGYDDKGNINYDTWYCPNCGAEYEIDYHDYKYCPECGQAILWDGNE